MANITASVRRRARRRARLLEQLIQETWRDEAALTRAAASGREPEAAGLAADLGCICVDRLHPALAALREAAQ